MESKKVSPADGAKDNGIEVGPALSALEYARESAAVLARVEQGILGAGVDADADFVSEGVLEVEFENGGKMVVNRHDVSREIWVAGRTGAHHFRWNGTAWVDTRSGESLWDVISALASQMAGQRVVIS